MLKSQMIKLFCLFLIVGSLSGCALAAVDYALGDNKAMHEDDQDANDGGNQGNFK